MKCEYSDCACVFKALSDETRLQICCILVEGEVRACDLLEQVEITQPTLSYHMKNLCESGLVKGRKDGCWMRYSINPECINVLQGYLQHLSPQPESEQQLAGR